MRTDTPLDAPLLVVNGAQSALSQPGTDQRAATSSVKQPGHYRIATRFGDEVVALTEDYLIDVVPDEKPTVQIQRPGRDYRPPTSRKCRCGVKAQDDFRLEALELRYSVNGGDWRARS